MKIAMLSPVAWRTPPRKYGPWEQVCSNITEDLVGRGIDITLFATGDSRTAGKLKSVCPRGYEEDPHTDAKVAEYMHISFLMEHADEFDIIHNHFDFPPLAFSRLIKTPVVTTIHGFSSSAIIPVYEKYNDNTYYVSISYADRNSKLDYIANIYNGINPEAFTLQREAGDYLLFFGRIHPDKGTREAVEIARRVKMKLLIAGFIQDEAYWRKEVEPLVDNERIVYVGNAGTVQRDELLGGAYALLHPINFQEPFGLSVAESMFCGTPVIAFNKGSMSELLEHGKNGFLVNDIQEAVTAMPRIGDIDRIYCRQSAEARFSIKNTTEQYMAVYEKILGG